LKVRRRAADSAVDLAVLDAMRLVRVRAHALLAVLLVVLAIALEPLDVAVAFEGEDVGRETVEEPAVVGGELPVTLAGSCGLGMGSLCLGFSKLS
jgi:hypothetical protein